MFILITLPKPKYENQSVVGSSMKVKSTRRRRIKRKKRKITYKIGILSFFVIMIVIIVLSAIRENNPQPIQKEKAEEYFSFSKASAFVEANYENKVILVTTVVFNITPIKGNATEVTILPRQGYVSLEESPYFDRINQGETVPVMITYTYPVQTRKEEEGYPLKFRVTCKEAEGEVIIYITKLLGSD